MDRFEKDRATIEDIKDGYIADTIFCKHALRRWPAALDRIAELERQLQAAALSMNYSAVCPWHELSMGCEQEPNCNKNTSVAVDCWREYWRRQSEEAT